MIFETLLPHAKALTKNNEVGERCFIFQSCCFGTQAFKESFEENLKQSKPKTKLSLPILFLGKTEKAVPGRFQGSNTGNASINTFRKIRKKEDFPTEWFPWLWSEKGKISSNDFLSLLERLNNVSSHTVQGLFAENGPLFTFNQPKKSKLKNEAQILEDMVAKSVFQVVTCNKPTLAVHSILALNALNEKAELFGKKKDPDLFGKELLKFCLLFWMCSHINSLRIIHKDLNKGIAVETNIVASENIGNISALPLLFDAGNFYLGSHTNKIVVQHPIVKRFLSLTREENIERISFTRSNKVFTAPPTGKAPTNAYRRMDGKSVLTTESMLGFDRRAVSQFVPAYSNIIQDRSFSLTKALTYYVFPEDVSLTGRYLEFLTDMIARLKECKQDYFNCLSKSPSSKRAKEEKEKLLAGLQLQRKALWEKSWSKFKLSQLLFAFEENVGSSNQPQFAWTSVYHHLPAAKAFLVLEMADDPTVFGRLTMLLQHTSLDLSEGWKEKEIKVLFSRYFLSGRMDQVEYWMRWRRYLSRNNSSEKQIDDRLWEQAMGVIIQIKAMCALTVNAEWTGKMLLNQLKKRRRAMDEENELRIRNYLTGFFLPGTPEQTPDTSEKGKVQVKQFIERQAKNYRVFVDTESDSWETIVDGLTCGWALKQICRKIRKDDYKSVIGGKSLAKHTPVQLRTLVIDLYSKAERAGASPWNVQAPIERMFKWSQKPPHTPEVLLFMDAVSLGFMRYDSPIESISDSENDNNDQNGGSNQ